MSKIVKYCKICRKRAVEPGETKCWICKGAELEKLEKNKPVTCSVKGCNKTENLINYGGNLFCNYHLIACSKKLQEVLKALIKVDYTDNKKYNLKELRYLSGSKDVLSTYSSYISYLTSAGILKREGKKGDYLYHIESISYKIIAVLDGKETPKLLKEGDKPVKPRTDSIIVDKKEYEQLKGISEKTKEELHKLARDYNNLQAVNEGLLKDARFNKKLVQELKAKIKELQDGAGNEEVIELKAEIYDLNRKIAKAKEILGGGGGKEIFTLP